MRLYAYQERDAAFRPGVTGHGITGPMSEQFCASLGMFWSRPFNLAAPLVGALDAPTILPAGAMAAIHTGRDSTIYPVMCFRS